MSCLTEPFAWLGMKMIPPALVAKPWLKGDAFVMLPRRIKSGLGCRAQTAGASPLRIVRNEDSAPSHSFCLTDVHRRLHVCKFGSDTVLVRGLHEPDPGPGHCIKIQMRIARLFAKADRSCTKLSGLFA